MYYKWKVFHPQQIPLNNCYGAFFSLLHVINWILSVCCVFSRINLQVALASYHRKTPWYPECLDEYVCMYNINAFV